MVMIVNRKQNCTKTKNKHFQKFPCTQPVTHRQSTRERAELIGRMQTITSYEEKGRWTLVDRFRQFMSRADDTSMVYDATNESYILSDTKTSFKLLLLYPPVFIVFMVFTEKKHSFQ